VIALAAMALAAGSLASACGTPNSASGGPASGGSALTIGISDEPSTLDVEYDSSALEWEPLDNVYEELTAYGHDGSTVQPQLALSWKEVTPKSWQFLLRPNVKFQDGEAFTPAAAVFSVKRALSQSNEWLGDYSQINGASASGGHAITITTSVPDPSLPQQLTLLPMIPPKFVTDSKQQYLSSKAVGTGPYEWVSYTHGQSVELAANPNWWGGKSKYADLTFKIIQDTNVRVQALQAGEIQFATGLDPTSAKLAPKVFNLPSNTVCYLPLNTLTAPFNDIAVRQAMNYAINRPLIVSSLFGQDANVPNGQLVTSLSFGYDPSLTDYPYDVAKAKSLLASSSYKNQAITILGLSGHWTGDRDMLQATIGDLRAAGFNIEAKFVENDVWRSAWTASPPTADILNCGSDDDLEGTHAMLTMGTSSSAISEFHDATITNQINAAVNEFSPAKRKADMQAVWVALKGAAATVPIVTVDELFGGQKDVSWNYPNGGKFLANDVTVSG
jgi:peptide/nickel transport system substrate-binding protein